MFRMSRLCFACGPASLKNGLDRLEKVYRHVQLIVCHLGSHETMSPPDYWRPSLRGTNQSGEANQLIVASSTRKVKSQERFILFHEMETHRTRHLVNDFSSVNVKGDAQCFSIFHSCGRYLSCLFRLGDLQFFC